MNPRPGRSITVQTYDGTSIPNSIDLDPTPEALEAARFSQRRSSLVLTGLSVQGPATGRYNCHGLVFASRRTNIPPCGFTDAVSIDDILRRDIYQKVRVPQLGDIAIYRNDAGEVDHSGIVCRTENIGSTGKVFVWSKWGA